MKHKLLVFLSPFEFYCAYEICQVKSFCIYQRALTKLGLSPFHKEVISFITDTSLWNLSRV